MDTIVNVKSLRFAIIRPRAEGRNWGTGADELTFVPDTAPMQDQPADTGKGHTVQIESNWWRYIEAINPMYGAYGWIRKPHDMWCNIDYEVDTAYSTAVCESVNVGCNVVAYTDETSTHIKLLSRPADFDTSRLDYRYDNWYSKPYLYFKAQAISKDMRFIKVGNALDAYIPLIHNTELWMAKSMVELFPTGYKYRFRGLNIYDGNIPLMTTSAGNVRTFYRSDWRLNTPGLIPPAGWSYPALQVI